MWMTLLLLGFPLVFGGELRLVNEWKSFDFEFPSEAARQKAIECGEFVEGNSVPIDVDIHYKGEKESLENICRFS
jgi:hypothetical protein